MDEREFFDEISQTRNHVLTCPHCQHTDDYALGWLVRRKKKDAPRGMNDDERARFSKAKSYMVRREDMVGCKNVRCRKRFEVVGVQSVATEEARPAGTTDERAARIRAAFSKRAGM